MSTHRIGFSRTSADEWELGPVTLRPELAERGYVEEVRKALGEFERVIAYADSHYFFDLVQLLTENPHQLELVSCMCQHEQRQVALAAAGVSSETLHWTKECGGQGQLMELAKYIESTGHLPE